MKYFPKSKNLDSLIANCRKYNLNISNVIYDYLCITKEDNSPEKRIYAIDKIYKRIIDNQYKKRRL